MTLILNIITMAEEKITLNKFLKVVIEPRAFNPSRFKCGYTHGELQSLYFDAYRRYLSMGVSTFGMIYEAHIQAMVAFGGKNTISEEGISEYNKKIADIIALERRLTPEESKTMREELHVLAEKAFGFEIEKFDFSNGRKITPISWGPLLWKMFHSASIQVEIYAPQHKKIFTNLFLSAPYLVLCGICEHNFKKKEPRKKVLFMLTSNEYIKSIYDVHNSVNLHKLNGDQRLYPWEKFVADWKLSYA